jgi:hypothetical protein
MARALQGVPGRRQVMVSIVIWLFCSGHDGPWVVRVPSKWLAPDAITELHNAGYSSDWARLVALYPGW